MRTSEEIKKEIIDFATGNRNVRAVLLNGSRANPHIKPDKFQDFDIMLLVSGIKKFTTDLNWTEVFGKKILQQSPDKMVVGDYHAEPGPAFHYLMLLEDGNRIDFTLFPQEKFPSAFRPDGLTVVWLDKDLRFLNIASPNDKDYFTCRPTGKEFSDYCNEFWWVSTNAAKGLARAEIIYAKEMQELYLRPVLMTVLKWYIGSQNAFSVATGKSGKHFKKYLPKDVYRKLLLTYSGYSIRDNWKSLFIMSKLFSMVAVDTAAVMGFDYNFEEEKNAVKYLKSLHKGLP